MRPAHDTAALQLGSVRNVTFSDISAIAENGIFVAGGPLPAGGAGHGTAGGAGCGSSAAAAGAFAALRGQLAQPWQQQRQQQQQRDHKRQFSISGLTIEQVQLQLVGRSKWPGGCQDYRPSSNSSTAARAGPGGRTSSDDGGGGSSSSSSSSLGKAWWPAGLDCSSGLTAALWVAGAEHVLLSDVEVGSACTERQLCWLSVAVCGAGEDLRAR